MKKPSLGKQSAHIIAQIDLIHIMMRSGCSLGTYTAHHLYGGGDADAFSEGSALNNSHYPDGGNVLAVNDDEIAEQIKYTVKYIDTDLPDLFDSFKVNEEDMQFLEKRRPV